MARITNKNLHKYFNYDDIFNYKDNFVKEDDDDADGVLTISWDAKNDKVDKLMEREHHPEMGDKLNMMWVEELKEVSGWTIGDKLYVVLKSNTDGFFNAWYYKATQKCYNLIIEPSGYVSRRYFNHYTMDESIDDKIVWGLTIRTKSVYNDKWCRFIIYKKN